MRHKLILREVSVFLLFVALAVALTWPVALNLDTAVSDFGDPLLNTFIVDWVCYSLTHDPLSLYDAPIFHPSPTPLAYSENLIAIAILVLPAYLAGASPIAVYNIAVLLGFALSGYGAYVAARMVSHSAIGAIAGGIFFAFCSFKFEHLPHLQIVFSAWVPLLLAALIAFWDRPTWRRGALMTLAWIANGLTNIYFLLFASIAIVFTVLLLGIVRSRPWRFYAMLVASTIAAVVILYPFLKPYRDISKRYEFVRWIDEVRGGSATWTNWLVPSPANRVYGNVPARSAFQAERQLFPGLMIVMLTVVGLVTQRRARGELRVASDEPNESPLATRDSPLVLRWLILIALALAWVGAVTERYELEVFGVRLLAFDSADVPMMAAMLLALFAFRHRLRAFAERSTINTGAWAAAVWIVVGVLGSFGANAFFYTFFYRRFEPFQAMRVPARFAIIAYAGLAVWGAIGVAALLRERQGWKKPVIATLLLALMLVEGVHRIRWEHVPREVPPVYSWLAQTRIQPIVELPYNGDGVEYQYVLGSTAHHVKSINGTSGFFPPEWWKAGEPYSRDAYDEMLTALEGFGTKILIVHGDLMNGERHKKIADWLRPNLASGRLAFLRRFDNEIFGDYVFAIPCNMPDWQKHRAPESPDPAGNMPSHNLAKFLDYAPTHSESIMIWTEAPQKYETVKGALHVRGWTLSPHGVRRVTLLLQNEKLRYDATLVARPDVKAAYPWMYLNEKPGFEVVVPDRPKNIRHDTSFMVEVEDHAGRVRRGRFTPFAWERSHDSNKK